MSILRISYLYLLLYTVLFVQACGPSDADVQAYIANGNYQALQEYVASEIESGTASLSIFGYEEPTTFEQATLALLTTSNQQNGNVGGLISENLRSITNSASFPVAIWTTLLNQETQIPTGLHKYYYQWYKDNESSFKADLKADIEERIESDSGFHPAISQEIESILSDDHLDVPDYREVLKLSKIIGDTETSTILEKALSLHQRKEELEDQRGDVWFEKYKLNSDTENKIKKAQDQVEDITSELEDFEEYSNAYIFSGLMIQRLGSTGFHEVYEVRDYDGTTYILGTTETYFSSRGSFRLRVVDGGKTIVRLREEYGGFVKGVSIIREVTEEQWNQYNSIRNELRQAKALEQTAQNSVKPTGEYDSKIASLEAQIEQLVTQIEALFNQLK